MPTKTMPISNHSDRTNLVKKGYNYMEKGHWLIISSRSQPVIPSGQDNAILPDQVIITMQYSIYLACSQR